MSKPSSDATIARGAGLLLIGVGLAPFLANMMTWIAGWRWVLSGLTLPIQLWMVRASFLRALLVLPIIPGVWLFAPRWKKPHEALARVASFASVLACYVDAFMMNSFISGGADDIKEGQFSATQALVDSEFASGVWRPAITTAMYIALAVVCVSIALRLGRKALLVLSGLTIVIGVAQVVFIYVSGGTQALDLGIYLFSVLCIWRTRAALRSADTASRSNDSASAEPPAAEAASG